MLKLQDIIGMTPDDPIHNYAGVVDEILVNEPNWYGIHRFHMKNNVETLTNGLFEHMSHPLHKTKRFPDTDVNLIQIGNFQTWLEARGEPILARIVSGLVERNFDADKIRITMMWILVNLEYFREKDPPKLRSIDDEWEI